LHLNAWHIAESQITYDTAEKTSDFIEKCRQCGFKTSMPEIAEENVKNPRITCDPRTTRRILGSKIEESSNRSNIANLPSGPDMLGLHTRLENSSACIPAELPLSPPDSWGTSRKRSLDIDLTKGTIGSKPTKKVRFLEPEVTGPGS